MTQQNRVLATEVVDDEEWEAHEPRKVTTVLGWALVVLLVVVVVVLAAVASVLLLVVSVWLTVAVPVVVLGALVGVMAFARRASRG